MKSFRPLIFIVVIVCLELIGTVWVSQTTQGIGYPLDDAWIHQTYARNLGEWGEWAFIRGQVSAGSTAPLWTFLLSIGYLFKFNHFFWSFLLGGMCLFVIGFLGWKTAGVHSRGNLAWFGIFLVGEWHLVWSALSGMETLLFSVIILAVFYLCTFSQVKFGWLGLLIGISMWVRPDGATLLGPALLLMLTQSKPIKEKWISVLKLLGTFTCTIIPYILINLAVAGAIFPNTFFAKQAEYAIMQQGSIIHRMTDLFSLPLVGAGLVLLPGFIYASYRFLKQRNWWGIAALLWWLGFTTLYALRLPVTYQHGRYLIPAMPVFWLIGWIGSVQIISSEIWTKIGRLVQFGAISIAILIGAAFLGLGAQAYSVDVAIINTEMVAASQWINSQTPEDAIIGAHDIGALGYFGNRKIIDLAGLISPEVIPFIRDEQKLLNFMQANNATFFMAFPEWYPTISQKLTMVFITQGAFSPSAGGENIAVYSLQK